MVDRRESWMRVSPPLLGTRRDGELKQRMEGDRAGAAIGIDNN